MALVRTAHDVTGPATGIGCRFTREGWSMKKLVCELCGSNDFTKDADDLFVCDYCRTKYTPAQAQAMMVEGTVRVDRTGEIQGLLTLATSALDSSNVTEALGYANRVLEVDPESSRAWFIKGSAAGWLSSVIDMRLTEATNAFKLAIQFADETNRDQVQAECAGVLDAIAVACVNLAQKHAYDFPGVDGTWEQYVRTSYACLAAFHQSYIWLPSPSPLQNMINVASSIITGIKYEFFNGSSQQSAISQPSPQQRADMLQAIEQASGLMRNFDASFQTPQPQTVKHDACFVVTATMGDESAVPVVILREFRDGVLVRHRAGRRFARWYYRNGPAVADLIRPSRLLRLVSLLTVVAPATLVAWVTLKLGARDR